MKSELGQYIPLHYHYQMLSDKNRVGAFEKAIATVVNSSQRVVELGSGTGVMAFNAARMGATVRGVEYNPALVSRSREFININGVADRVQIIHGDAMEWMPEEPADVVICEMLHSALLREKQVEAISKFRNEHLKRFNKIPVFLPTATLLGVQPVWQKYDFAGYRAPVPLFQDAYTKIEEVTGLSDPIVYKVVDYNNAEVEPIKGDMIFELKNDAQLNALRFITKSVLSIDSSGETTYWHSQHLVVPLDEELQIKSGQEIRVRFNYTPGDPIEELHQSIEINLVSKFNESNKMPSSKVFSFENCHNFL